MSVATPSDPAVSIHPMTRAQYHDLLDAGHLADVRVELLEGVLIEMPPMNRPHSRGVQLLNRLFTRALPDRYMVGPQTPIAASDHSEPHPDISIEDYRPDDLADHATTAYLVIEVTHSTHRTDLVHKPAIYASADVGLYWVIDLLNRRAVIHADPVNGVYTSITEHGPDAVLEFEGVRVVLADLLQ